MSHRLLIIDDDLALARTLQLLLKSRGVEADVVLTGQEGIAALIAPQATYQLALIDVRLPDISGWDVLAQARTAGNRTPVALMSGYPPQTLEEDPRRGDVVAIFRKPVPLDEVLSLLAGNAAA